jgi:small subunit ribosomal protein S18
MRNSRDSNRNSRNNSSQKKQLFSKKFKSCPFSSKNSPVIDYKNVKILEKYISEKGKIIPSRISFVSCSKQRLLSKAIKKARTLALLSHVGKIR